MINKNLLLAGGLITGGILLVKSEGGDSNPLSLGGGSSGVGIPSGVASVEGTKKDNKKNNKMQTSPPAFNLNIKEAPYPSDKKMSIAPTNTSTKKEYKSVDLNKIVGVDKSKDVLGIFSNKKPSNIKMSIAPTNTSTKKESVIKTVLFTPTRILNKIVGWF